jgi:hypothetical protein
MDEFCREKGFAKWFETSAKENINIETSARFLNTEVTTEIQFYFYFKALIFLKIMKHTEQLQPRPQGGSQPRSGTLVVHDKPDPKASSGRKCCGGGVGGGDSASDSKS